MPSTLMKLADKSELCVVITPEALGLMQATSFRGPESRHAWNFSRFANVGSFMRDECIRLAFAHHGLLLAEELERRAPVRNMDSLKLALVHPDVVGWSATAPVESVPPDAIESVQVPFIETPRNVIRVNALPPAPRTKKISATVTFLAGRRQWVMYVWRLYPGQVMTRPKPDSGTRTGVFYDWRHPGA